MPLFKLSKFHHGFLFGIGFRNKIIALQVIVKIANKNVTSRKQTASRQRGWLIFSWIMVLADTENPRRLNILRLVEHLPKRAVQILFAMPAKFGETQRKGTC